jgi:hypothetical protein
MSEFTDANSEMFSEAMEVLGTTAFSINGNPFAGDLDELGGQSYTIVLGGREVTVAAHLVCQLEQFGESIPSDGRLKVGKRLFTIAGMSQDSSSVTFSLTAADAN